MARRDRVIKPKLECKHQWRYCKGTNLKECVLCYEMTEVSHE